jgi:hypothetical protein
MELVEDAMPSGTRAEPQLGQRPARRFAARQLARGLVCQLRERLPKAGRRGTERRRMPSG